MSTHMPGFQSFFRFFHHFVLAKLANSSIRADIPAVTVPIEGMLVTENDL